MENETMFIYLDSSELIVNETHCIVSEVSPNKWTVDFDNGYTLVFMPVYSDNTYAQLNTDENGESVLVFDECKVIAAYWHDDNGNKLNYDGLYHKRFRYDSDELETLIDSLITQDTSSDQIMALAMAVNCNPDEIEFSRYDDNTLEYGSGEYLVIDDYTADQLWDQELENYLDECILPELEGHLANYFDTDQWKRDARIDGRAHSLARYDGDENSVKIGDEWYYIYRTN